MPRQSTEEPVAFPGGIPYPHDGPLGRATADDGWDAAVVEELGHELAELWDATEQPPVAGRPDAAFPAAEHIFPAPEGGFHPDGFGHYPNDGAFHVNDAAFHVDGGGYHLNDGYHLGDATLHPDDVVYYPGEAAFHPGEAVYHPGEAVFSSSRAVFLPDEPAFDQDGAAFDQDGAVFGPDGSAFVPDEPAFGPAGPADLAERTDGAHPHAGPGSTGWSWRRLLSATSVLMTAAIAVAVAALGAVASYPSLRAIANGVAPADIAGLWPLLIYGPWVVATLSILRARVYRRRTLHSWAVVIFFAAVATLLCVARVHPSPAGVAVAGLPPLTVLLCFHQFVRQLDIATAPPPAARHAQNNRGQHRHRPTG
ncbi:DUF2637 domain-containing protein [Streptomyces sp. NPDC018045]|uniref:DUF2637 domain-containing protein n=1 Tax=Streptomyces sp. NPDC018045 TaxID=3365037 RepID=UPI003799C71A